MIDIYKIENKLNGMPYIGQTKQGIKKRFNQHCLADSYLGRTIRKYGKNNFTIEVIEIVEDELANDVEHKNVLKYNCVTPNGYNMNEYGRLVGLVSKKWYIGLKSDFYRSIDKSDIILYGYFLRILDVSNKDFMLMKNHKTPFRNWKEIYESLGVTSKNTQTKLKKFCEKYNVLNRENKLFVLNKELFQIIY